VKDLDRRLSFGAVADRYDRSRPDYPPELVDDVIAYAGCGSGSEVLEIGAGTGKATRMFCARGLSVVAVEPDGEMAAVASRQAATAGHNVRIIQSDFESAPLPDGAFPLAYSGQAWHWVDPAGGFQRARRALAPGGVLAAFWNRSDWSGHGLRAELLEAYERNGASHLRRGTMHPTGSSSPALSDEWDPELATAAGFGELSVHRYERVLEFTSAEYVAMLSTHSDHILLEADQRERLRCSRRRRDHRPPRRPAAPARADAALPGPTFLAEGHGQLGQDLGVDPAQAERREQPLKDAGHATGALPGAFQRDPGAGAGAQRLNRPGADEGGELIPLAQQARGLLGAQPVVALAPAG
jgi:SAM-dependent methyltransferase